MELHRVVIIVGTKVVTHRVVTVCIRTGTTRSDGGTVIGVVSVLQTTTIVGAIRGASGGGVACWALGVDGSA